MVTTREEFVHECNSNETSDLAPFLRDREGQTHYKIRVSTFPNIPYLLLEKEDLEDIYNLNDDGLLTLCLNLYNKKKTHAKVEAYRSRIRQAYNIARALIRYRNNPTRGLDEDFNISFQDLFRRFRYKKSKEKTGKNKGGRPTAPGTELCVAPSGNIDDITNSVREALNANGLPIQFYVMQASGVDKEKTQIPRPVEDNTIIDILKRVTGYEGLQAVDLILQKFKEFYALRQPHLKKALHQLCKSIYRAREQRRKLIPDSRSPNVGIGFRYTAKKEVKLHEIIVAYPEVRATIKKGIVRKWVVDGTEKEKKIESDTFSLTAAENLKSLRPYLKMMGYEDYTERVESQVHEKKTAKRGEKSYAQRNVQRRELSEKKNVRYLEAEDVPLQQFWCVASVTQKSTYGESKSRERILIQDGINKYHIYAVAKQDLTLSIKKTLSIISHLIMSSMCSEITKMKEIQFGYWQSEILKKDEIRLRCLNVTNGVKASFPMKKSEVAQALCIMLGCL